MNRTHGVGQVSAWALSLAGLFGTASPATAQAGPTACLVVYRPYAFTGLPMNFLLWQDRQALCRLRNSHYVTTTVPVGLVTLRSRVV